MNEIELKFQIDEAATRHLRARVRTLRLASGKTSTRTLRSVYLDTPAHALKKAGITLRMRRDGRRWIQTVKTAPILYGGLSQVGETENPAPGGRVSLQAIPDPVVRDVVMRSVNGAVLQPVCETVMKRTAVMLASKSGTRAELAIDVGEIHADGRSAEFREAEIELIEGGTRGLFDMAQGLLPDDGWRFSRLSKGARGYLLAEQGRIEPEVKPQTARIVALDRGQTVEQAARDMLRECFDQISTNVVVVRMIDDLEGPHQLRVGLRRLRSALTIFSSVLDCPEMIRLQSEARWLGQEVGRLRDIDVISREIVGREAGSHPDEPGLAALVQALAPRAAERRRDLCQILSEARVHTFLLDLARFVETRGWLLPHDFGQTERLAEQIGEFAGRAINRRWKKVCRGGQGVIGLDIEQRHDLRKELKKLRYVVEFLAPLYQAKRVAPFVKRLRNLQTIFGDFNDAATVKALFADPAFVGAYDPATQRAVGWVIGASLARADCGWAGVQILWRELTEARRFWK